MIDDGDLETTAKTLRFLEEQAGLFLDTRSEVEAVDHAADIAERLVQDD